MLVWHKRARQALSLVAVFALAWLGQGALYHAPDWKRFCAERPAVLAMVPLKTIKEGTDILRAEKGDATADDATLKWKDSLRDNLLYAAIRSVAHTLFAPYPWVAFHSGLTGRSANELYYLGVLLWVFCLPGITAAIALGVRSRDSEFWLVVLFLLSQLAAYTIWQGEGEWSTRQRVFALPAFLPWRR